MVCQMGETHGYLVDPMSAANMLAILAKLMEVPVNPMKLNDQAAGMKKAIEIMVGGERRGDEELSYIG